MGGWGSGQWRRGKRLTSDQCAFDVRLLHRQDALKPGMIYQTSWSREDQEIGAAWIRVDRDHLTLTYRYQREGQEWQDLQCSIALEQSPVTYGGTRPWLQCAAPGCGRRVALLNLADSGIFACRRRCGLFFDHLVTKLLS